MIRKQIEIKIRVKFTPLFLEVKDESYYHNAQVGSESHFKVILVSDRFNNEGILSRHRMVYAVLADELAGPIHALVLRIYTIKEWEDLHNTVPAYPSPKCRANDLSHISI